MYLTTERAPSTTALNHSYLRTDHLLSNLTNRTISSGFVTIAAQAVKFVLGVGSTVILARLLSPRDFGLVAMVTAVTGFLTVLKDAGLSTATVQQEDISHAQISNLFWINAALSGLIALAMIGLSPAIAKFYHEPRLIGIALLLSVSFLLNGATVQHLALLQRQMRFMGIALIEVGSMVAGFISGVAMAFSGYGYWSLVGATLSAQAVALLLTWCVSEWRPQSPRRRCGTRPLLSFGANLTVGGLIFSFARGADNLLIGRVYGSDSVGLYSRGTALLMRPLEQFLSPISAVVVPALSRLQSQQERYRRAFLQIYEAIALMGFFFTGLLLALARPLTVVLLGPEWEGAAVIFGCFTVAALYAPLANSSVWLLTSQGRAQDLLFSTVIGSSLMLASFVVGLPFGPNGVAIAFSASGLLIRLPILYYLVGRRGPINTADLWSGFFRHLPLWGVAFGSTYLTSTLIGSSLPASQLLISASVGVAVSLGFILAMGQPRRVALNLLSTVARIFKSRALVTTS